jgi:hypothetical protein
MESKLQMLLLTYVPFKYCYKCKLHKKHKEFSKNGARPDKLGTICRKCKRQERLERAEKHRDFARQVRKQGCIYCGENDGELLDFHHIDPSIKTDKVSSLYRATGTKFMKEVKKCEVVCAGCHRKLESGYKLCKLKNVIEKLSCINRSY